MGSYPLSTPLEVDGSLPNILHDSGHALKLERAPCTAFWPQEDAGKVQGAVS